MTRRTRRSLAGSVLMVLGLVIGAVVVTALHADGRERSKADTNDGGAWLLKRDAGYVGHVNRLIGEVTAAVSVADPGSDYDVDQAPGIIVVHDRTKGTITLVDDTVERVANPAGVRVGQNVTVHAIRGGALIVDRSSMRVWKLTREQLLSLESLDEVEAIVAGEGPTISAAMPDGHAVFADIAAGTVVFLRPDGTTDASPAIEMTDDIVAITMLGPDRAVLADADGDLVVASSAKIEPLDLHVPAADGSPTPVVLQQPGDAADALVAATPDGRVVSVPLDGGEGEEPAAIGELPGGGPTAPIMFGGCVFAVSTAPPTFAQWCSNGDGTWREVQPPEPLTGAGPELRLRLVNGWVWINDLDSGAAWVTSPMQRLNRVEDWGSILSQLNDDESDENTDDEGGDVIQEVDPDDPNAEIVQSDEIDEEGPNKPPIARDDEAQTRVDRPIAVDVLGNDTDPNGDVLIITSVQPTAGDAVIEVAPDGRSVQVSPAAGYAGVVTFTYTITDGRDESATAAVTVQVRPSDGSDNRPPEAHNDIASTRRGRPTTFDVLANDVDPDGDALVLDAISVKDSEGGAGVLVLDPSGQVVFTPDPNTTSERIDLTYTVSDDFGATDEGTVVVAVRLEDANNEPDARNDAGVTVVGKPVRLDVLANDTDPDNDPLFVAQLPTLVRPTDRTVDSLDLSLTPDGELFFNPDTPGTYVFNYSATDGEETDVAQIRIEVGTPTENRPPVAVRDDVVIAAGGSRLVYVMGNDGDADGDIIGLVGHTVDADSGLTVKEVAGVGYLVTVAAGAPARPTFRYQISDGRSDPVSAVVVVAVTDGAAVDQVPVARADVTEVRAGGKVNVPILDNDYDPEGGALKVVAVTPVDGVDVAPGLNGQTVDIRVGPNVLSSFTLSYTVADAAGNQSSTFLDVRIVPPNEVNRPPIARTDTARTRSGVPVTILAVANDSDPDGDVIAVESIRSQPTGGVATVEAGALVYTPTETFTGTDRFTYALVDAGGEIAIGEVLVGVMPRPGENRAPEAFDDNVQAIAGSAPLVFDVLDNDSDPDGDQLRVTLAGTPVVGTSAVDPDGGGIVFTPPATLPTPDGNSADIAFTYAIDDGRGGTASATITVTVLSTGTALAPIAVDDQVGPLSVGESIEINMLANDIDPDGDPAGLVLTSSDPALTAHEAGVITLTAGETSTRHTYTITDAGGLTDTAEVDILVVPNRAPEVVAFAAETAANTPITVELAGQATDPDGDTLYYSCCDTPQGGAASTVQNGAGALTVTFDPDDEFAGQATFAYTVDDQQGHIVSGSVTINVLPPANSPPTVEATTLTVEAGTPTNIDLGAMVTDPDPDDTLTYSVSGPENGSVALTQNGDTVQASAPITGSDTTDSFTFTVTDGAGESASGTVHLTVTPPNDPPPEARADEATTNQGEPVTLAVLGNDIDPLGGGLTVISVGASDAGAATTDGSSVTFAPAADFFGPTTFIYRVRDAANTASRESEAQVSVTVIGRPTAPGTPVAREGNATAAITWAAPPSNGAPIDEYEITVNGGDARSVGTATGYTWDGLANGVPVTFAVRAHNSAGWSEWSGSSPSVTPDIEPGRPAAPTVQFADGALIVTWAAPTNEGSAITNYDIQIGGSASAIQRIGATTQFRWEGLTNGQAYTFQVRAVNAKGQGEFSSPSSPEHPLREPDAPAAPVGERGDKTINVTWGAPPNGGDPIIEYEVTIVSSGATNRTTANTIRWANLPNGQPQQFTVRARNRAGWGAVSPASSPVVPCGVPDAPTAVAATRGDGSAAITWAAPYNQGCAITGYTITASGGATMAVSGEGTSATFAGLSNGTSYTFTVVARNEVGDGARSGASNAVTPAGPPGGVTVNPPVPDTRQVTLTWSAANPNGSPITSYQLSVNSGAWTNIGTATTYTRTGLANGTTYTFQIRAVNDVSPGPGSNTVSATTPGPPDQVGGLAVSGGRRQISASWSAPAANGKPITRYEVELDNGTGVNENNRSHTFTGLQPDTQYRVRVRACNEIGCGAWSAWQGARTDNEQSVRVSRGSAVNNSDCNTSGCAHLYATLDGMPANTTYQVDCFGDGAQFDTGNAYITTNGNGHFDGNLSCFYGFTGKPVYFTINGRRSDNTITW